MTTPAIKVEGVWKEYVVGAAQHHHGTFYDLLTSALKAPLQGLRGTRPAPSQAEPFWALQDIHFEVPQGEVVGIIGRNGAGKSTLLKILSRITAPTRGRIEIKGRLASLLEVGTGFHPELSGRENIFLNGAILGMSRAEIVRKFDEIVAFAELGQFIDTPVKRYSSGMYVRLAFAVSAHLDVDVLVVDEVLAVGDAVFQERCLRKMEDVSKGGRTVLFVSHNLGAVSRLCSRAILLHSGRVVCDDEVSFALNHYSRLVQGAALGAASGATGPLVNKASIEAFTINRSEQLIGLVCNPSDEIEIRLTGRLLIPLKKFRVTLCIFKQQQLVLSMHDAAEPTDMPAGDFESIIRIPAYFLSPGEYAIDVNMYSEGIGEHLLAPSLGMFSVATEWAELYEPSHAMGVVNLRQAGTRTLLPTPQAQTAPISHSIAP